MTCCMSMIKKRNVMVYSQHTHKLCAFYVNINYEGNETVKRVNNLAKKKTTCTLTHTHR